jgi:hypothetical protein
LGADYCQECQRCEERNFLYEDNKKLSVIDIWFFLIGRFFKLLAQEKKISYCNQTEYKDQRIKRKGNNVEHSEQKRNETDSDNTECFGKWIAIVIEKPSKNKPRSGYHDNPHDK